MDKTIPSVNDLMTPLEFDQDDLNANRQGELGHNQRDRLKKLQTRAIIIGLVGFLAFSLIATILLFFGGETGLIVVTLIGVFMTILNAIYVGMFARQYMRLRADLESNQIDILSGELERVVKADKRMNNFLLRINDAEFYVQKDLFKLFRHEVDYRFYRTRHSNVLLAAEPLADTL